MVIAGLLILIVSGCAGAPTTQQDYVSRVEVRDSEFDPATTFLGPQLQASIKGMGGTAAYARFRSYQLKQSDAVKHQLYIDLYYSGKRPRFFESASFPGGTTIDVDVLSQERLRCHKNKTLWPCDFHEVLAISLSGQFLQRHSQSGFRTRLNAHTGDQVIVTIPAHFVSGQLEAMGLSHFDDASP